MKSLQNGSWWVAAALGLAACVAWAQSTYSTERSNHAALQTLLNQGFEVKAASTASSGLQVLYLQKTSILFACPLAAEGLVCSRVL
jgi:hypothetical protein